MQHSIPRLVVVLIAAAGALLITAQARAKRAEINSLSDCIVKADVILMGVVQSKADEGETGVVKVRILGALLKGKSEAKGLTIADLFFRSDHKRSVEGELIAKPEEQYIFFLKALPNGGYELFNSYDGIIPISGPVVREIENQLLKAEKGHRD